MWDIIRNLFTEHPKSVGETYWQHCKNASRFGVQMILGGLCCLVHSILPFIFKRTASSICNKLNLELSERIGVAREQISDNQSVHRNKTSATTETMENVVVRTKT